MIRWHWASRLSIKKSLSEGSNLELLGAERHGRQHLLLEPAKGSEVGACGFRAGSAVGSAGSARVPRSLFILLIVRVPGSLLILLNRSINSHASHLL